jgi:regulator of replication initiation timing
MSATFTEAQQTEHRGSFIRECRQKAWGAACHAEWIGKQMDDLMEQYRKLSDDNVALGTEIQTLEAALDAHTKDNREKRKDLQARRTTLIQSMEAIAKSANEGQKAMQQLYASVESSLALATHAEGWSWKEKQSEPDSQSLPGTPAA